MRDWRRRGATVIELITTACIVFIVLAIVGGGCCGFHGMKASDGYRVGQIQKASANGIVFTTNEIEVTTSGHKAGMQGGMTNVFEASCPDDELFAEIQGLDVTKTYKFYYHQERLVAPWRGGTGYIIWKVEEVKPDEAEE